MVQDWRGNCCFAWQWADSVYGWSHGAGWSSKRCWMRRRLGSMANCVTQRKPRPACSQPLMSGRASLKPFRMEVEWPAVSERTLPETENSWKTKQEEECDYWIGPLSQRVNRVGKHAVERVDWCFWETDTVSAECDGATFTPENWQKNESV